MIKKAIDKINIISTIILKIFPSYVVVPYDIFISNNDVSQCTIYENCLLQHQEIHRIYDKEKIEIPYLVHCNYWIANQNTISLLTDNSILTNQKINKLVYNEIIPHKLWLVILNNIDFYIVDIFNYVPSNAHCTLDITNYNTPKEFADAFIQTIHIKYKKYLERVYLTALYTFKILKDET